MIEHMATKERIVAALRGQPVDYVPMAFHFWHSPPRHPMRNLDE